MPQSIIRRKLCSETELIKSLQLILHEYEELNCKR